MLLLRNGKIFTLENGEIIYGDILVEEGKISKIAANINATGARVVELSDSIVLPGLIDCSTSLGLVDPGIRGSEKSAFEMGRSVTSDMRIVNGLNMFDEYFEEASRNGITTVVVSSGSQNVIGSQSCAVKTQAKSFNSAVVSEFADLKAAVGSLPTRLESNSQSFPRSRMGVASVLWEHLRKAQSYMEQKMLGRISEHEYDGVLEGLIPVLKKQVSLKVSANRIQDILKAVELKDAFGINIIINGGAEAYEAIDILKKNKIPVILGPFLNDNSSLELQNRKLDTAKRLTEEGIKVALSTHHPTVCSDLLLMTCCLMAKHGMSYENNLKAVTINPAEMLGLDDRIGSISVGKDADFAIFDGDPFKSMTKVLMTVVDGRIVHDRGELSISKCDSNIVQANESDW